MEPRTTLPFDVLAYIIDLLARGDDGDIKSLQILSQACKFMVPLCRKHIFSSLHLGSKLKSECFSNLLSENPHIARYVRKLDYPVYNPVGDHELNILDMLKERSSLESIKLLSPPGFYWNDLPESIRSLLVFLDIQLPTVTHLDIESFKGFPATALSCCSNLIDLQLRRLEMTPPKVNQVISRSKIPTPVSLHAGTGSYDGIAVLLNSASLHAGGPIVDFSRLQKATFDVRSPDNIGDINELIKVTTQLQHLYITMDLPTGFAGRGASLAITNAYRTLKLLALSITHRFGDDCDPLCGLSRELRLIAGNNILEELELDVVLQAGASCRTESEDWSAFDSVLTEFNAFPMLHRVSAEIWCFSYGIDDVDEDGVLESLKEDKFPRLVESKVVEFNFSAEIHYV